MRLLDVSHWGFLFEHENIPYFIPLYRDGLQMESQIQIREDFVVRVKSGDHPFLINEDGSAEFLTDEHPLVPMIKRIMVAYALRNMQQ